MSRITKVLLCVMLAACMLAGCSSSPDISVPLEDVDLYAEGYNDGFAAGRAAALEEMATPTPTVLPDSSM